MRTVLVLMGRTAETCGLLTLARRLGDPVVVTCRRPHDAALRRLGAHGAGRVCVADGGDGADPMATAVEAFTELSWQFDTFAILATSDRIGREIAARTAVRLGSGIVTGAVDVRATPDGPVTVQEVCGGAYRVESLVKGKAPVVVVEPQDCRELSDPVLPVVEVNRVDVPVPARRVRVVSRRSKTEVRPLVTGASVVVAGGRGVGSRDGFALIERVAQALGGAVGATHTAADSGWCPHDALVGQTGAVVHPRLYVACGISGSVHHRAGMRHARTIVAIDKDPAAPIFRIADVGVVGDLHQILPALLAELARRKQEFEQEAESSETALEEHHPGEA